MTSTLSTEPIPQGDLRLLDDPIAQRLLHSTELGHLAYVARDGEPRVIPIGFVWNGEVVMMATFARSPKINALRARPTVALTIDRPGPPPEILTIRGRIELEDVSGVPAEYRQMQTRYYGEEQAAAAIAGIEQSGARMVLMTVRPLWVDVLDFHTRLPSALTPRNSDGER